MSRWSLIPTIRERESPRRVVSQSERVRRSVSHRSPGMAVGAVGHGSGRKIGAGSCDGRSGPVRARSGDVDRPVRPSPAPAREGAGGTHGVRRAGGQARLATSSATDLRRPV